MNEKDTDGDGYDDNIEIEKKTDPADGTKYPIDETTDSDGDGITDMKEDDCGLDKRDPDDASADNDDDGLKNKKECELGTNINKKDTDGDGYEDGIEVEKKTSPKNKTDFPKSYVLNIIMIILGLAFLGAGIFLFIQSQKDKPKLPKQPKMPPMQFPGGMPQKQGIGQPKQQGNIQMPKFLQSSQQKQTQFQQNTPQQQDNQVVMETFEPVGKRSQEPTGEELDYQIKKKREEMKLRQMSSVFEEFGKDTAKQKKTVEYVKEESEKEKEDRLFNRLDDISEDDAFEELEKLKRRKR